MTAPLLESPVVRDAARVTLAYVTVFILAIFYQMYGKVAAVKEHRKAKAAASTAVGSAATDIKPEPFNRYAPNNARLIAADRVVGNFLEWAPAFTLLFWMSALLAGKGIELGWAYVAIRCLYMVLAHFGGIRPSGARPLIFVATVPMYLILAALAWNVFTVVFL